MKTLLTVLLFIVALFLLYALYIVPEYQIRIIVALILDVFLLLFFLFYFYRDYLYKFFSLVTSSRFKYLMILFSVLFVLLVVIYFVIESKMIKKQDINWNSSNKYTLSNESASFLSGIDNNIEFYLIKSKVNVEQRFYGLSFEIGKYLSNFSFAVLNNNIDAAKLKELEQKSQYPISSGDVVMVSQDSIVITNDLSEQSIVGSVNLLINGKKEICVLDKFEHEKFKSFGEKGLTDFYREMLKSGLIFRFVKFNELSNCKNIAIFNIESDLSNDEINAVIEFKGKKLIAGGMSFKNLRSLVENLGFIISQDVIKDTGSRAIIGSGSTPVTDKFCMYSNVVLESPYSINCSDCIPMAFINEATNLVLAQKDDVFVLSSFPGTNFFMRYQSNVRMFRSLFYKLSNAEVPGFYNLGSEKNSYLVISPRYLNLIFLFFLVVFPLFPCLVGIYIIIRES